MRPFLFCLLLLCLTGLSCQQRYAHVKRVRVNQNAVTEQPKKTQPVVQTEPPVIAETEQPGLPGQNADTCVTEVSTVPEKVKHDDPSEEPHQNTEPTVRKKFRHLLPLKRYTVTEDPSPNENLMMVAMFVVWILIFMAIAVLLLILFLYLLFAGVILAGITFYEAVLLFAVLAVFLEVAAVVLAFIVGNALIKDKLGSRPKRGQLWLSYFIAVGICLALLLLYYFISPAILLFVAVLLVFLAALIYVLLWEKKDAGSE